MANNIRITGRLAADPELRYTAEGKATCKLRIPVYAGKKYKSEEYNPSLWFGVVLWEEAAEEAANRYRKGTTLTVYGMLSYEEWEGKDGKRGSYLIIKPEVKEERT